ncbi:hypothetical protein PHLGIDRAFT_486559 [Phlebiopsis gigantea 11061_1 CR5-6]|uniref:Uncharacterized protein n=1 Tax=Phlebiopsis gigantea (strain 11061_1 CR5-6) TaxID=745531 RepID=A0A0C3PIB0_PHLG1|nr:hypothetical protein PHLGIDRAFT_486559 [Phlebiopsis gigantea 11061_1 CR5-6]
MADVSKDLPSVPLPPIPDEGQKRPGLVKRITTKLRTPSQSWAHPSGPPPLEGVPEDAAAKHRRKISLRMPTLPGPSTTTRNTNLENAFTSPEQREAALRACGLIPAHPRPGRDTHGYMLPLSEQEERLDHDWAIIPNDAARLSPEGESEAQRIKDAWLKKNHEAQSPLSSSPPPRDASRSPDEPWLRRRSPRPISPPSSPPREAAPAPPPAREAARSQPPASSSLPPRRSPEGEPYRPDFHRDPNVARLMQAMQGYKPENYRPTPKPASSSRFDADSDSDADSA